MTATSNNLNLKLATTLLEHERQQDASSQAWTTGIRSIDAQLKGFFTGGKVIGLASCPDADLTTSLATHIISTQLTIQNPQPTADPTPQVFIISPPSTQTAVAIATCLSQRLQHQPADSRPDSTALLSHIQILQYLSLSGLTESLADVSAALYDNDSASASASTSGGTTILLLQGLSAALSETARRSGATHTAAVAANILRSLAHLSRTYAARLLVLIELDLEGNGNTNASTTTRDSQATRHPAGLPSAFSSLKGDALVLGPAVAPLGDILDGGMDEIVVVHGAFGRAREHDGQQARNGPNTGKTAVVEVVKDRTGGRVGEWCLWVHA
ncbi:uncharacterized protein HMPREF1541_00706 [Cyphellophora europaea CBS 101466]|uniref:Uncharacterized protein n=1 Tax=Cyphellophora europaea (strain CBS 101466) TaxID=1220924 RepID=W2SCS3_CYPE1|nr:uncharacterized protein HMPREF1541_00706 [Cyphellophora europaea CBS 101466]ETN46521.1 hypothetical protein HMPREF1541_00706 [Cyphellophora europaea CBS 101466]